MLGPCLDQPGILVYSDEATPQMLATLERERMTARIEFLTRNRDAMVDYLDAARRSARPAGVAAG